MTAPARRGIRVRKDADAWNAHGWTSIPNRILDSATVLGAEPVAAFCWMARHREDFEFTAEAVARAFGAGIKKAEGWLYTLESEGWLTRHTIRNTKGWIEGIDYVLHPIPVPEEQRTNRAKKDRKPRHRFPKADEHQPSSELNDGRPSDGRPTDGYPSDGRPSDIYKEEKTKEEDQKPPPPSPSPTSAPAEPAEANTGEEAINPHNPEHHQAAVELLASLTGPFRLGAKAQAGMVPLVVGLLAKHTTAAIHARLTEPLPDRVIHLPAILRARLADMPDPEPEAPQKPSVPDWCGQCHKHGKFDPSLRLTLTDCSPCPTCHPLTQKPREHTTNGRKPANWQAPNWSDPIHAQRRALFNFGTSQDEVEAYYLANQAF